VTITIYNGTTAAGAERPHRHRADVDNLGAWRFRKGCGGHRRADQHPSVQPQVELRRRAAQRDDDREVERISNGVCRSEGRPACCRAASSLSEPHVWVASTRTSVGPRVRIAGPRATTADVRASNGVLHPSKRGRLRSAVAAKGVARGRSHPLPDAVSRMGISPG